MKGSVHSRYGAVFGAVIASLVVGVVAAGAAIVWVTTPASPTVTTCVGKATGYMRVIDSARQQCGSWETRLLLHNAGVAHRVIVRWGEKVTVASGDNALRDVMCEVGKGETAVSPAYEMSRLPGTLPLQIDFSMPLNATAT